MKSVSRLMMCLSSSANLLVYCAASAVFRRVLCQQVRRMLRMGDKDVGAGGVGRGVVGGGSLADSGMSFRSSRRMRTVGGATAGGGGGGTRRGGSARGASQMRRNLQSRAGTR